MTLIERHRLEVAQDRLDGILEVHHLICQMMEVGLGFDQLLGGQVDFPIRQEAHGHHWLGLGFGHEELGWLPTPLGRHHLVQLWS